MKIVAVYQFYLPYLLPRHPDWKGKDFSLNSPPFDITVTPRDSNDPVIAKNDVFSMSMRIQTSSIADAHSRKVSTPEDSCCDRIQVAVRGEVESLAQTKDDSVRGRFAEEAIEAANIFIEHCRVLSRQPGMTNLRREVVSDKVQGCQFPYSMWWYDPEAEKWLHGMSAGGSVSALIQNPVSWEALIKQLGESLEPPLQKTLILDARLRFAGEQLREAVLAAATAVEVSSNLYIEAQGAGDNPAVSKILEARMSFADKRLNAVPELLSKRSLKAENKALFDLAERLYRVRNTIAHHGVLVEDEFITDRQSSIRVVKELLDTAEQVVAWLSKLSGDAKPTPAPAS